MAELTALEQEIIEATGFKMKRFANRQDYLAAIARAMEKMDGDAYDNLSDEASDWYQDAATAVNANDDIPDFPEDDEADDDATEEEADVGTDDDEAEEDADEADDEADEDSEDSSDEGEESEDDEEGGAEEEPEPEPKPKKERVKAEAKADKPTKAKANGKVEKEAPAAPKSPRPEVIEKMRAKKEAAEAKAGKVPKVLPKVAPKASHNDDPGRKDRYGYFEGTKVSEFCKLIEKGASMADVKDELGDTFYNTMKKLREAGHSIEKNDAGKFVLRHKDDVGGKRDKGKKG